MPRRNDRGRIRIEILVHIIPVARGIDDGNIVVLSLELPQGNIDGDTTLSLGLELVQHPGVLEGALSHLVMV